MEDLMPSEYAKRYDIKPWNLPNLTDQNANKQPQYSTKKPEHPQPSGFVALFYRIVQYVPYRRLTLHRMLTKQQNSYLSIAKLSSLDIIPPFLKILHYPISIRP